MKAPPSRVLFIPCQLLVVGLQYLQGCDGYICRKYAEHDTLLRVKSISVVVVFAVFLLFFFFGGGLVVVVVFFWLISFLTVWK